MKRKLLTLALLSSVCLCSSGLAATPNPLNIPDPHEDPAAAAETRVAAHKLMMVNLQNMLKLAGGLREWNGFHMIRNGDSLEQLSRMSYPYFLVEGSYAGTKARPEIYDNVADFKKLNTHMETATSGLAAAIQTREAYAVGNALPTVVKACNACHQKYMQPALLINLPPPPEH